MNARTNLDMATRVREGESTCCPSSRILPEAPEAADRRDRGQLDEAFTMMRQATTTGAFPQ